MQLKNRQGNLSQYLYISQSRSHNYMYVDSYEVCMYVAKYLYVILNYIHPVVNFRTQPQDTTVCRGSYVIIRCRYRCNIALPIIWVINGTLFTQEQIVNSSLYQLNNPTVPSRTSLSVLSILLSSV